MEESATVRGIVIGLGACVLLGGCTLDRLFETGDTTASRLSDGYFYVEIEHDRLEQLGGASSPALHTHLEQAIARKGLCKDGYTILDEGTGRGYYYVKGRCR